MTGTSGDPATRTNPLPREPKHKGEKYLVEMNTIPEAVKSSIDRYIENGIMPGSFVAAVLSNDLMDTWFQADDDSRENLEAIIKYVACEVPSSAWGSREKVENWIRSKRNKEAV